MGNWKQICRCNGTLHNWISIFFVPSLFCGVKLQSLHNYSRLVKPYLFNILCADEEADCSPCSSETWDNNWHYFNRCYISTVPTVRSRYTCRKICIKSLANLLNFLCSNIYFTLAPLLTMGFSIVKEHCSLIIIHRQMSGCDHLL